MLSSLTIINSGYTHAKYMFCTLCVCMCVCVSVGGSSRHIGGAVDLLQLDREAEGNTMHEESQSPLHLQQPGQRMG